MFACMTDTTCLLFFPGTRPELAAKAAASGAGRVCVDLEDSVAPASKAEARASALELLESYDGPAMLVVRINHPSTPEGRRDVEAIAGLGGGLRRATVMVPKTESARDLAAVAEGLGDGVDARSTIPVIETARGVAGVEDITAAPGVSALLFGGLDLSVDLGCALDWEPLLYARSRCVLAARLAGIQPIDTPWPDLDDTEGLRREAERARRLGFTAKAAIHPAQVATIRDAFVPTEDEVERARRIVDAHEREGSGVFRLDGVMVDRPVVDAARRLLDRSSTTTHRASDG